ncbi:NAD(P)/FAD-dependent oxidoreductase [Methylogaea oryzae]|uniref:NADH dehydrogenase n=1 Tax=Methylogaea oryzae TaxID=1295382 RepID=A0A8D4VQQ2_9GAMM|nr:NAD(P)/FAD-dependent oxidoreductase [Methylogaea oryzae]BBL72773.1 NADH dehydrogenase [Methylogaea oryzae]
MSSKQHNPIPKIVVVGGGAGGLELVTRLGNSLGRRGEAEITLVDCSKTHVWKPLLHEVAAGTLDSHEDELEYLAQANTNHFRFILGRMQGLDGQAKTIRLAPILDSVGAVLVPVRDVRYDILVMAVGSVCNDYGIKGVAEHCMFLDTTEQAERFQERLMEEYVRAHVTKGKLEVVIIGGGATGIELAAQLHEVSHLLNTYGLDRVKPADVKLSIVEASPRLLPELPARLSDATLRELHKLGVDVLLKQRVVEVSPAGVKTDSGQVIPGRIKVWAAGIKAPDFMKTLGLETNRANQLVVRPTLQSSGDDGIFAIGDCAACPWPERNGQVPPRAQSAHQMADLVHDNILRQLKGRGLKEYRYRDYGSLVSLGKFSTVGNLMGGLGGSLMIEGFVARMVYLSLYKMHQLALFGVFRVGMLTLSHFFRRSVHPKIKLH